jgi:biotin transport system substrate-specific component
MPLGMPLTLQTFAIMLAGIVLGAKNGTIATITYVLLGTLGAPVFSAFTGGIGIIFGRTGGFILSFPLLALAAGIGTTKENRLRLAIWLTIGAIINFTSGVLMFSAVVPMNLQASFYFAAAPFIPTELVKIALLVAFGSTIKKRIGASTSNK